MVGVCSVGVRAVGVRAVGVRAVGVVTSTKFRKKAKNKRKKQAVQILRTGNI